MAWQRRVLGRLLVVGQVGSVARQRLLGLVRRQSGVRQLAHHGHGVDDRALQRDLCLQPSTERRAGGRVRLGHGRHRRRDGPLAVEFGNLVGGEFFFLEQALRLFQARLGFFQLGLLVADGVEPALHQLGHAAVGVAHRGQHLFQRGLRLHVLGSGQAHAGKLALQDQGHGASFVTGQRGGALRLLVTAAGRSRSRGRGSARLRCARSIGRGLGLGGSALKDEIEHGALWRWEKPPS